MSHFTKHEAAIDQEDTETSGDYADCRLSPFCQSLISDVRSQITSGTFSQHTLAHEVHELYHENELAFHEARAVIQAARSSAPSKAKGMMVKDAAQEEKSAVA